MNLNIIYRVSAGSYKKNRLEYATKERCFDSLMNVRKLDDQVIVLDDHADGQVVQHMLNKLTSFDLAFSAKKANWGIFPIDGGSSAQSFNVALDFAMKYPDDEIVYLVEDDYLHRPYALDVLREGLQRADYVSLYDHPDKYLDADKGGNPYVDGGGEVTRVITTKSCHWKLTNSTTLTFACEVKTLKQDIMVWRQNTVGTYPRDFDAFMQLRQRGRTLLTPIPGYATHTEVEWLSPFIEWTKY